MNIKDHLLYLPLLAELFLLFLFGFFLLLLLFLGLPILHAHKNAAVQHRYLYNVKVERTYHFRVEGYLLGQTDAVTDLKTDEQVRHTLNHIWVSRPL